MNPGNEARRFGHCLCDRDVGALRRALGHDLLKLYSPAITVSRFWASGRSFSFHVGSGAFLSVESDWQDTPQYALDYHTMSITLLDHPKNAPRSFDASGRKMVGYPVSVVDVGAPRSPIVSIAVLEHEEAYRSEAVRYDSGLIFRLEDRRRVAIVVHRSIEGGLECATEPVAIDEVVAEYRERLVLD